MTAGPGLVRGCSPGLAGERGRSYGPRSMGDHPLPHPGPATSAAGCGRPRPVHRYINARHSVVYAHDSVAFASQLLRWRGLHQLPVIDARGGLIGLVTDHGLLDRAFDPSSSETRVADVMKAAHVVDADADVASAIHRLVEDHLDCLVVVRGASIVGLFACSDALRAASVGRGGAS